MRLKGLFEIYGLLAQLVDEAGDGATAASDDGAEVRAQRRVHAGPRDDHLVVISLDADASIDAHRRPAHQAGDLGKDDGRGVARRQDLGGGQFFSGIRRKVVHVGDHHKVLEEVWVLAALFIGGPAPITAQYPPPNIRDHEARIEQIAESLDAFAAWEFLLG